MSPQQLLQQRLECFFQKDVHHLPDSAKAKIIRIQVPIDSLDPLLWLSYQSAETKTYWSDRDGQFVMAGVGALHRVRSKARPTFSDVFSCIKGLLPENSQVRYYGGFSFDPIPLRTKRWEVFGTCYFVVPQFELYAEATQTFLACNLFLSEQISYQQQLANLLTSLKELVFLRVFRSTALPVVINRQDFPGRQQWFQMLDTALGNLTSGDLFKIVLARRSDFTFSRVVEPLSLLSALRYDQARLFRFCFQPIAETAFVGASPERLYHRLDRLLKTEAIAGTRPRGVSLTEDEALGHTLLDSEKDNREHQVVVQTLQSALSQLCRLVQLNSKPVLLKLNQVQHLQTVCTGILADGVTDEDILPLIHPTPAVGGHPKQPARIVINQLEPFERGWYAAPVGWVSSNATEFAVAIRSGLVVKNQLSLFSGAGIVAGSDPDDEWQEIESKIRAFTSVFNSVQDNRKNRKSSITF